MPTCKSVESGLRMSPNKHWLLSVGLGQVLSLCITATSSTSSVLWQQYAVSIPYTQNFFNYLLLAIVYGWGTRHTTSLERASMRTWQFFAYSLADVQANILAVFAFKSTSVLSALVLSSWTLPCIMILSIYFTGVRYNTPHYCGVFLCLVGLGILVGSDIIKQGSTDNHSWIGDFICLLSATLYAISNVTEEYLVVHSSTQVFLSQAGIWGSIVCGLQALYFEYAHIRDIIWSWPIVGLVAVYVMSLFTMYSLAPTLYRLTSATFMSMSLITSNFYSLVAGLLFFDTKMPSLYPFAYALVLCGVTTYHMTSFASVLLPESSEYEPVQSHNTRYQAIHSS